MQGDSAPSHTYLDELWWAELKLNGSRRPFRHHSKLCEYHGVTLRRPPKMHNGSISIALTVLHRIIYFDAILQANQQ